MTLSPNSKGLLDEFYNYLCGILEVYRDLVPVLKTELSAIEEDKIDLLDKSMQSQQSLLLKTRSFDTTVEKYMTELGYPVGKLSDLIDMLPAEEKGTFSQLLEQFSLTLKEVNFYKEKCTALLQSKLYTIDKYLEQHAEQKDNVTYNNKASEVQTSLFPKAFEKKI